LLPALEFFISAADALGCTGEVVGATGPSISSGSTSDGATSALALPMGSSGLSPRLSVFKLRKELALESARDMLGPMLSSLSTAEKRFAFGEFGELSAVDALACCSAVPSVVCVAPSMRSAGCSSCASSIVDCLRVSLLCLPGRAIRPGVTGDRPDEEAAACCSRARWRSCSFEKLWCRLRDGLVEGAGTRPEAA
jgi:hypothetical protein